MQQNLEAPGTDDAPDWASLFRSRGNEVVRERPVFTGDVFLDGHAVGEDEAKAFVIVQHPCVLRRGTDLTPRVLAAEVLPGKRVKPSKWATGNYRQLPLADLRPGQDVDDYVAHFDRHLLVAREDLVLDARVACMSQVGVNLLMQRWVHHNSRVIVPTHDFQKATGAQFDEADIIEEWCLDRVGDGVVLNHAEVEIDQWLTGDRSTNSPRSRLDDPQQRSAIRRAAREHLQDVRRD